MTPAPEPSEYTHYWSRDVPGTTDTDRAAWEYAPARPSIVATIAKAALLFTLGLACALTGFAAGLFAPLRWPL